MKKTFLHDYSITYIVMFFCLLLHLVHVLAKDYYIFIHFIVIFYTPNLNIPVTFIFSKNLILAVSFYARTGFQF